MTETPYYDLFGEDNDPCRCKRDWELHLGYTWAPHTAAAATKKIYPEIRQEAHCPGSDSCLCELCRYTRLAPVIKKQEQDWERRRLIKQALNAENREIAERAAKLQKLKDESVEHRPLELD